MARVELSFLTVPACHPRYGGGPVSVIRLMTKVRFQQTDGRMSEPWDAIVDTGAPFGVLPLRVWRDLAREIRAADSSLGGISQRKNCQVAAAFGTVRGQLADDAGATSRSYQFPTFLARTNRVPLLLGFSGLLDSLRVYFDYGSGEAWVHERVPKDRSDQRGHRKWFDQE